VSALAFVTHSYTPLAFRPAVERHVLVALTCVALVLWGIVLPVEVALGLHMV
jgi:hypothetical protein